LLRSHRLGRPDVAPLRSRGPYNTTPQAYLVATRPPPPQSEIVLPTSGAAAGRSAVEALVAGAVAHHEGAAIGAARRVRLRAEGDRVPAGRVEHRPAGEADRIRPRRGMRRRRGGRYGAHRAGGARRLALDQAHRRPRLA